MDTAIPLTPLSFDSEKMEKQRPWAKSLLAKSGFAKLLSPRQDPISCPPSERKQERLLPRPGLGRRLSKVGPGLRRPGTFKRQNSERREKLIEVEASVVEQKTVPVDRRRALSARPASPPPVELPKFSAPEIREIENGVLTITRRETWPEIGVHTSEERCIISSSSPTPPRTPAPDSTHDSESPTPSEGSQEDDIDEEIQEELEKRWILNLSMHFRDQSPREKFFLTYAETPQKWRRITISCDYRDAPPDSLERDLQSLQFQRDKSARIYESIRLSLPDIQFYDTVTNLKLETRDDRLHVHVTEDTHEIIPYPAVQAVQHIKCNHYRESELSFESHMSGFVYKVSVVERDPNGHRNVNADSNVSVDRTIWVKKEVPGPDSVEEFLYEINALNDLKNSKSVIKFQGLVVDEEGVSVKGLLIAFAEQGTVVDIIYDHEDDLPWLRRERWAQQIVQGLSEIHEAGFVQGDFTLSNIVIDKHDDAKIIDINRRGCPLGWEPPEISRLVESGRRISMYIGVKSDLFQLGMVLWALAEEVFEPERQQQPLSLRNAGYIPQYYRNLVDICLSPKPRDRLAASDLLRHFPSTSDNSLHPRSQNQRKSSTSLNSNFATSQDYSSPSQKNDPAAHLQDQNPPGDHTVPGSVDLLFDRPIVVRGRQPSSPHLEPPQFIANSPSRSGEEEVQGIDGPGHFYEEFDDFDCGRHEWDGFSRDLSNVDLRLEPMELAGIGGHETLREIEAYGKPEGLLSKAGKADSGEIKNEEPEPLKLEQHSSPGHGGSELPAPP